MQHKDPEYMRIDAQVIAAAVDAAARAGQARDACYQAMQNLSTAMGPTVEQLRTLSLQVNEWTAQNLPKTPDRIYCTRCRSWRPPQRAHRGWASCPRCGTKVRVG